MKRFLTLTTFLCFAFFLYGQERTVTGVVTDANTNEPLPGVSIVLKGTVKGVTTDLDGNYTINVEKGQELTFSYMGYLNETVTIDEQSIVNISLIVDMQNLDEVIVIGYGTQKKSLVTGAISKVDGDDLNQNQARVEQSLQGKTAGVNIMQESGAPGALLSVRIRGTSTNGNANPLFIVDGMRTTGIEYLNANDIESVEILKDAASAAIYGAEAANGVILITTKGGSQKGQSVINYNFSYGIQQPGKIAEVMDAQQYATYYREGLRNEILSNYEGIDIPDALMTRALDNAYSFNPDTMGAGTDWLGEIFQTAPMTEHNLSFSGGNETTSVFASGSFFNQDGIVGGSKSNFKRYTARLNVDHKAKDWASIGTNISYTHFERTEIDENNEFGGVISNAMNLDPLTPVYYSDTSMFPEKYKQQIYDNFDDIDNSSLKAPGDLGYYGMSTYVQNETANPRAQLDNKHDVWTTDKLLGGANLRIMPIEGLTVKSDYSIDLSIGNSMKWKPEYYYHSVNYSYLSTTQHEVYQWFTWQWENTATYTKQFGDHNFMFLGGMTLRDYNFQYLSGKGEGLQEETWNFAVLDAVLSDSTKAAASGRRDEDNRLMSYFGRVQYNYQEKYMVDLVLRSDASSKLSKENRTQYFPSVSVGWVLSNESFWNVPVVNFVKLRASWGQNGSIQTLDNFQYVSLIKSDAASSYYISGGTKVTGSEPEALSNADLVWETSQQTDIGLDLQFLRNKLSFTADYYNKKTIDLITEGTVPEYVGNVKPKENAGDVTNTGVEMEISYRNVAGDFSYNIGLNAAYNKNEVTTLATPLIGQNLGTTGAVTRSEEGEPIWFFYGYETDGIFDSFDDVRAYTNEAGELIQPAAIPGDVRFKDLNNDGVIDELDKTNIGSPHPDWIFGFNLDFSYKNIDLSIFFNGTLGNEIYYGAYRTDLTGNNKPLYFYENAWTLDNPTSDKFPRYTVTDNNGNFSHSDLFVFDGSYLRMQNLELGYTLPSKITDKAKINSLRFYVSARNLFVITTYPGSDPEIGNSADTDDDKTMKSIGVDRGLFPKSKVFTFGLNLTL
jgi:TonB-dependent starch-binding outer membrane protein SusC